MISEGGSASSLVLYFLLWGYIGVGPSLFGSFSNFEHFSPVFHVSRLVNDWHISASSCW